EIIVILIMNSIEKLILSMDNIYDVLTGLEKIGFVTDLPLERDEGIPLERLRQEPGLEIELDKVCWKFKDAKRRTLRDVSLRITPGEKIVIAGYNGSGKSTLLQLLGGLYDNFEGMITFNGVPLRSINPDSLRERISTLSIQDEIFNGSLIENIHLGDDNIPLSRIIAITKAIGLHQYVNQLPDGYQTELVGNGLNIPRSSRTKIILARTLISQPEILLLEDFMSRIEPQAQTPLWHYLTSQQRPWTMVAITNDPRFAAQSDRVIILQEGLVVADGPFEEVRKTRYAQEVFQLNRNDLKAS
ncbi:MAG: ATP-binding cassette domain-containing protein, partial [Bacteroidota bacterium]